MANLELKHYGVLGMKWGKRRSRAELDRVAGRSKNESVTENESKSSTKADKAVANARRKVSREKAAKYVAKGAEIATKLAVSSVVDDVFYGGAGKRIAKETIKQTGRAVVTAYTMANGGYDIHWYDK